MATITLNRPEKANACNDRMLDELADALEEAERDAGVRCLILTGAGKAFCAGQDLGAMKDRHEVEQALSFGDHLRRKYNPIIRRLRTMRKPVVASVNGAAAGAGLSLALACDLRIASEVANFVVVFIQVGLIPDSGGSYFLPRLVGLGKAMELAMTGEPVDAVEAEQMGLVNRVVAADQLDATTRKWAEKLAAGPTRGYGLIKRALNQGATSDLETALEYEAQLQEIAGRTADHQEGVMAFLEKRRPEFQGE